MTPEEHQAEHLRLHAALDELLACYLSENNPTQRRTSIHDEICDLLHWSHQKTLGPSPNPGDRG